jgi:hypothetical protein
VHGISRDRLALVLALVVLLALVQGQPLPERPPAAQSRCPSKVCRPV